MGFIEMVSSFEQRHHQHTPLARIATLNEKRGAAQGLQPRPSKVAFSVGNIGWPRGPLNVGRFYLDTGAGRR